MQTNIEQKENELLKNLLKDKKKTAVRVSDCLLDEVDKLTDERQDWVNLAVLEKIARETNS